MKWRELTRCGGHQDTLDVGVVRATNGALVPATPLNSLTTVWFGRGGGGEAWGGVGEGNLTTGLIWSGGAGGAWVGRGRKISVGIKELVTRFGLP